MTSRRNQIFAGLSTTGYDLLVVGGGITGAGVARDAAGRGLRCLLVEKGDFASGTSSKSGKLIHGGARYLKYAQWGLVFEACRERWLLQTKIAPHICRPIRFVVPCYADTRTPRWLLAMGLAMYELLSLGRNPGHFHVLSPRRLAQMEPQLDPHNSRGGVSYWDCACLDFRLVIETLKSAEQLGADVLNYTELIELQRGDSGFVAIVRDVLTGTCHRATTHTVINAAGPWADDVQSRMGTPQRFRLKLAIGIHLVVSRDRLPIHDTFALEVPKDGRMIYAVPWDRSVLIGTTDTFFEGDKDSLCVDSDAVEYLLSAVNRYFPRVGLTAADVLASFVGARPLVGSDDGHQEDELPRDDQVLHSASGIWAVTGGKLTTYRAMARRAVDQIVRREFPDRPLRKCSTIAPLPGALEPLPPDASDRLRALWSRYGAQALRIEELIRQSPELAQRIDEGAPYVWGEVLYAREHEYVERIDDLVDRRLGAFMLAPGAPLREKIERWLDSLESISGDQATSPDFRRVRLASEASAARLGSPKSGPPLNETARQT